jgi:CDP-diglyceride synthetase
MAARIATGLIGGALFILLYTHSYSWALATSVGVNAWALWEFMKTQPSLPLWRVYLHIAWGSALLIVCANALSKQGGGEAALTLMAVLICAYAGAQAWQRRNEPGSLDQLNHLLGLAMISLPLAFLTAVASWPGGFPWLLLLMGASFGADTGAIAVGKWLGKTQLAPWLSPKKSVEGLLGGVLSGGMCWALSAALWQLELVTQLRPLAGLPGPAIWALMFALGGLAAFFGAGGDLVFSLLKRNAGLKDYGAGLPGHGGFLDRFDALLFCAPLVYALCLLG